MTGYKEFTYAGTTGTDIHDLSEDLRAAVDEFGITDGIVTVFTPGSTASVTTIEYESGALQDLAGAIERLAPRVSHYDHDARWGDGNGYSHVRSALLGPSVSIPLRDGALVLGTWQQVIMLDFDNKARQRRVVITAVGEG